MTRLLQIALLLAIITPFGLAKAEFYTGNDLHARCSDNRMIALGYVMGHFDASKITEVFDDDEVMRVCLPTQATNNQVLDVVCKRLASRPEERHHLANWLVLGALQDAFPCPKKKPKAKEQAN